MHITVSLVTDRFFFGFNLWLGAYPVARNSRKITVHLTGWGILFYAFAIALEIVWGRQTNALLLIPALMWIGAALYIIPEEIFWRQAGIRIWMLASIPVLILTLLNIWFSLIAILAWFVCLVLIASEFKGLQFIQKPPVLRFLSTAVLRA